jgi:uncharacterized cupin superfamily protein
MVETGHFKLSTTINNLSFESVELPSPSRGCDRQVKRCKLHRTQGSSLDIWEYGPGEFDWQSDADQSACILSGEAEVDLADGRFLCLQAGGAFFLPRGLHGHWIVKETLRTVTVRGG